MHRMIRFFGVSLFMALATVACIANGQTKGDDELRVLTFNIHAGRGLDGKLDLQRIADVIIETKPDLVALQEVDVRTKRSGKIDQAHTLARLCNMKSVFGRAIDYQGGEYGNAILTTKDIIASKQVELSNVGAESRSAVGIAIELPNKQIVTFISTHWDHRSSKARVQAASKLAEIVRQSKGVVLIGGDLNCEMGSPELAKLEKRVVVPGGESVNTFPVDNPTKQIDFLLIDKHSEWTLQSIEAIDPKGASDHRPLLAVFKTGKKITKKGG